MASILQRISATLSSSHCNNVLPVSCLFVSSNIRSIQTSYSSLHSGTGRTKPTYCAEVSSYSYSYSTLLKKRTGNLFYPSPRLTQNNITCKRYLKLEGIKPIPTPPNPAPVNPNWKNLTLTHKGNLVKLN